MTPERWAQVREALERVLDLPVAQRDAALARLGEDDPALLAEVRALLANEHTTDAVAPRMPRAAFEDWDALHAHARIGRRVGAFTLEALLGSGGSSLVFAARRTDGFAQRVAIKLLRADLPGGAARRRFERERDILAAFSHPHIARFLDAGFSDEGEPYLALELIEGDGWSEGLRALPRIEQRLALFLKVCDAVAYAHERLRVHRDLKPGNLMLDAQGQPKLLDFGIAALLEDAGSGSLTRETGSPLTPAWSAPEQVRGEAATTATDVHALGLLLYELLTGGTPFQRDNDQQTLRAVLEFEPPRPSRAAPASETARIPSDMRRDLDNIVRMALEKSPARRYPTVRQLASDVSAAMERRPVSARTQNVRYVAGRLWARHRLAISLTALALCVLLAAAGTALWQGRVALHERERAATGYAEVRRFAQRLIFDYQEGIQKLPGSLPLQKRLVDDALQYLALLERDAGGDAAILSELASAWMKLGDIQGYPNIPNLGDTDGALRSYARSEAAIARLPDPAQADILRARLSASRAGVLFERLDLHAAQSEFETAIAAFERAGADKGDLLIEFADTLDIYGDLLGSPGGGGSLLDAGRARTAWERAKALRETALAAAPDDRALRFSIYKSRLREGVRHMGEGDPAAAEADYLASLDLLRQIRRDAPHDAVAQREIALVLSRLAPVQDALGKPEEAIAAALESLALLRTMLAEDPGNESIRGGVTAVCGWASKLLIRAGRLDEAEPIVALQIDMGQERLRVAPQDMVAMDNLSIAWRRRGEWHAARGEHAAAIAAHRTSLDLLAPLRGKAVDYDYSAALSHLHIGRTALAARDMALARDALQRCVDELSALIDKNPDVASWYGPDLDEARRLLDEAMQAKGHAASFQAPSPIAER